VQNFVQSHRHTLAGVPVNANTAPPLKRALKLLTGHDAVPGMTMLLLFPHHAPFVLSMASACELVGLFCHCELGIVQRDSLKKACVQEVLELVYHLRAHSMVLWARADHHVPHSICAFSCRVE